MLASLIFFLEVYHFLTHVLVLFGIRLLPRKDLVKQRVYFMIDLVCANISYWIHGRFWILIGLQNLQHLFYFFTWEQRYLIFLMSFRAKNKLKILSTVGWQNEWFLGHLWIGIVDVSTNLIWF